LRWVLIAVLLAVGALPRPLSAQVLRGTVTERVSAVPIPGVLVSAAGGALRAGDTLYVLTNARGAFAVQLPGAGAYTVAFKRIGVAPHTVALTIAGGETRLVDISLDPVASRLPVTEVRATNLCLDRSGQLSRIVALWDEVRTVLRASEVTRRDQFIHGWLSLYERTLEPRTLRILNDQRSMAEGLYDRPMRSVSFEELAASGFWGGIAGDTLVFNGPDAEVLLSETFQRDYCFQYVEGRGNRRSLLGIEFRPRRGTTVRGITGTMWLDMLSFELRFVEFRYAGLVTMPSNPHLGGEVHFARHESGGWVVQRWHLRMPQFSQVRPAIATGHASRQPPVVYRIIERGGSLYAATLKSWENPGTIVGTVMDSTGRRPMADAHVSLSGTPFSTITDGLGAFRFDSIIPGAYALLVSHPSYVALGQLVTDAPFNLGAGETFRTRMKAAGTNEIRRALCEDPDFDTRLAVLRVQAVEADSGLALTRLRLWLRWRDPEQAAPESPITPGIEQRLLGLQSETDATGTATFCGVPPGTMVELVMLRSDDDPTIPEGARLVRVSSFLLEPGALAVRMVSVRRPR
jgi:hypothetical protein